MTLLIIQIYPLTGVALRIFDRLPLKDVLGRHFRVKAYKFFTEIGVVFYSDAVFHGKLHP